MITWIALPALTWLGSLFVYSGSLKLLAPMESNVRVIQGYKILPAGMARVVGVLLPSVELALGAMILLTPYDRIAALATAVFGTAFAVGAGSVLVRGIETSCGCAGKASGLVGRATVARALLIAFAGVAVTVGGGSVPSTLGWLVFGLALVPAGAIVLRPWLRRALGRPGARAQGTSGRSVPVRVLGELAE